MVTQMGLKWGTDQKVRLFEPKTGMHVSVSAYGEFNIRVIDSRKILLKLVGTTNGLKSATESNNQSEGRGYGSDIPTMNSKFRGLIITKVKNNLANVIKKENISLFEIDSHLEDISRVLQDCINEGLKDYGLMMPEFYVMNIATPEDDDPQDEFGNPNQEREAWMLAKSLHAQQYIDVQKQRVAQATAEAERERLRVEVETDAQMRILEAKGEAEALKIQKAAEAEAYRMKAEAEAAEMQMKGYSFRDQMARDVSMEAMKNGLTGTGSSAGSIVGDVAGLGVALGAMNGVMGVTRDTIQPMLDNSMTQNHANRHTTPETWDCPECGAKGLVGKFCPECGEKRPEVSATWDCPGCGAKGLVGKFCPECGAKRPDESKTWDCPECGAKGLVGKFCPECGAKRPEASATWDCPECGAKELSTKFCPKCGAKRPTEVESATWDCPGCGAKGLSSQNCPECGRNREEV
jgi:membrane protease subunit (stomatin/prohibitin family)